jgi:photosystem II stability/assembly factor-like uncharacterized protein
LKTFLKISIAFIVFCLFTLPLQTQWVQQTLPVNKPITGIKFVDSLKGWACTGYGSQNDSSYILYTTNAGTSWLVQLSVYNIFFTDLNILSTALGFACGYDNNISLSKLFITSNSGISWTPITMVPNMLMEDMQFLNKDSAWECGSSIGPDVRTTTNGGNSWIVRTSGITQATQKIFFLNYNTGFCGAGTYLYKTTNAGMSWVLKGNFSPETVTSIYFLNENTGWLGATGNAVYFTTNSGLNWQNQTTPSFAGTVSDIYFTNLQTGWGGISYIVVCKTTNSGLNWGYQMDTSGSYRFSFVDSLHGWSGYYGTGKVSRTTNGGGLIIYTGFVSNSSLIPRKFTLYQNYPNPFNPSTTIELDLPVSSKINLIICDILGRELYKIADEHLKPGSYTFTWDARKCASGIYFYRLTTDDHSETKKMILIK